MTQLQKDMTGSWIPTNSSLFDFNPNDADKRKINLGILKNSVILTDLGYRGRDLLVLFMVLHDMLYYHEQLLNHNLYTILMRFSSKDATFIGKWTTQIEQITKYNRIVIVELFKLGKYIEDKVGKEKLREYSNEFEGALRGNHTFGEKNPKIPEDANIHLTNNVMKWKYVGNAS